LAEALTIFDTLKGRKVPFKPLHPRRVSMFVCGPTVQGRMHMGHARNYVLYDVLAKYLSHLGYKVNFVMNITDIDASVTSAARLEHEEPFVLARRYERLFLYDMLSMGIDSVTSYHRVSGYVEKMIRQIEKLLSKGHAYAVDGWVYFDASTFPRFGRLSHQSKAELALRPLELSTRKRGLLDFSLWRPETLVEGRFASPWGFGSPGWHIQDTAVTESTLGFTYDIHGGGYELIYPHHEAEIAQGESLSGKVPMVRYWVHTRLVNEAGEKMSKSVGNVRNVNDLLKSCSASELRYFLLSSHYRKDMDLSGLEKSIRAYRRLRTRASRLRSSDEGALPRGFARAMNDDLDTPRAEKWISDELESGSPDVPGLVAASRVLGLDLLGRA